MMSYSFYLLHQPIIQVSLAALDKYFPQLNLHPLLRLAIAFAVYVPLLPVAYAFFRTIERPSIKLGEWFWTRLHPAQIRPVKRDWTRCTKPSLSDILANAPRPHSEAL